MTTGSAIHRSGACIIEPDNRFLAGCPRLGAVNCDGTHALGCFWSDALGWPLVWDHDEESAIQAPDGTGPKITWSGPPLMPKSGEERLHFHIAPTSGTSAQAALEHLLSRRATRPDTGHACPGATVLADIDGNKFCASSSRSVAAPPVQDLHSSMPKSSSGHQQVPTPEYRELPQTATMTVPPVWL